MNFSRLIKAMAIIGLVGFGSYAMGAVPGSDDFESYTNGPFFGQAAVEWTVSSTDESAVNTYFVTALGELPACATNFPGASTKLLDLNTGTNELSYAAGSTTNATVLVGTLLKVVGSDTAPVITGTDVQAAVYLNTTDELLYVYSTVDATNGWTALTPTVTNGQWICLQIEMDYDTGYGTGTPYVNVYVDGAAANTPATIVAANKTDSFNKRSVASVSLRGTGMVDNFSVTETASGLEFATIITEAVDLDNGWLNDNAPGTVYQVDVDTYLNNMSSFAGDGYTLVEVNLLDGEKALIQALVNPVSLAVDSPTFTNNGTYYVQGKYAIVTNNVTVDYQGVGAPPDPAPTPVAYDATFQLDLNGIIELDGTLEIYVVELDAWYYVGDLTAGVLSIPNVTAALTVQVNGTYPSALPTVTIVATDDAAAEAGPDTGTLTVYRDGSTNDALTVYFTVGGTATSDSDYTSIGTNVVIAAGETNATITVTPIDDPDVEVAETVIVTLAADAGYDIGTPSAGTVTITSDDVAQDVVINDDSSLTWTTKPTGAPVTFSFSANGSVNSSPTMMAVLVSTTVDGTPIAVTGTVTAAEAAGVVTGTVEIDVSGYNKLFFRGFRY